MTDTIEGTTGEPAPVADAEKKAATATVYVILHSNDGETWTRAGEQEATNKSNALSYFYETAEMPDAELFQAIPLSSWKPLRPKQPRPRIPFGEVEE